MNEINVYLNARVDPTIIPCPFVLSFPGCLFTLLATRPCLFSLCMQINSHDDSRCTTFNGVKMILERSTEMDQTWGKLKQIVLIFAKGFSVMGVYLDFLCFPRRLFAF